MSKTEKKNRNEILAKTEPSEEKKQKNVYILTPTWNRTFSKYTHKNESKEKQALRQLYSIK